MPAENRRASVQRPEITWSIMHPVRPDPDYMRAVIAAAAGYQVDSFEICGDAHSSLGGIEGAIHFRDYPAVAPHLDLPAIDAHTADLRAIVTAAHRSQRPVCYWHREVMVPRIVVDTVPGLLDADGEFDLLGDAYHALLRSKIAEFFHRVPEMDGLVLTVTESDYSVIHNSRPDRYPPAVVMEKVIRTFAGELGRLGRRFVLRSFGSIARDYEDILAGARRVADEFNFEIETKITPYDFSPFLPFNAFLHPTGAASLSAEYDSIGEFLGAGYLPAADPARVIDSVAFATAAGVGRHVIRIDRIGHPTFGSTQEINLLAFDRAIADPSVTADAIWAEWAKSRWPECGVTMSAIMRRGIEMVKKTHFIDGHVIFHAFPIDPGLKWIKASGILSVFRPGIDLARHQGMWGILTDRTTPTRAAILAEKEEAVRLADTALADLRAIQARLPRAEFRVAETAWLHATAVTRLVREWTRCVCAYFDDIETLRPGAPSLESALATARPVFEKILGTRLPHNAPTAATATGQGHEYADYECGSDTIEDAYAGPLWRIILALRQEYTAELAEHLAWHSQPGIADFIVLGGIAHDYRVHRYMHASHAALVDGLPLRTVGNRVFPNGFVECRLTEPTAPARLIVTGDPAGATTFRLTIDGVNQTATLDPTGRFTCPLPSVPAGTPVTVCIQKLGNTYPRLRTIALASVSD